MSSVQGKNPALHIATYSGWYRFERRDGQWHKTHKALTFWKLTSLQVDPPMRPCLRATEHWACSSPMTAALRQRAKPNVPRLTTNALLALPGTILPALAGGALSGAQRQRLARVGRRAAGRHRRQFPPSPELSARVRYLAADNATPRRLFAAIEVGGLLVSDDDGAHWTQVTGGFDDADVHNSCEFGAPGSDSRGLRRRHLRSTDRGDRWQK